MQDLSWLINFFLEYGYAGMFLISFLGSTIFVPLAIEIVIAGFISLGLNPFYIVLISAIGSTLGSVINYFLGSLGIKYYKEKVKKIKNDDKLSEIANKYGVLGLFAILAIPLPLPVDIITIAAGISKMDLKYFLIAVFLAKILRYSFYAGIIKVVV